MPAVQDRGRTHTPRRRPAPKRRYVLPPAFRTEAAAGQGYTKAPPSPYRPAHGRGKGYTLPQLAIPRGDAGHSLTRSQQQAVDRGVRAARVRALRRKTRQSERGPAVLAAQLGDLFAKHTYFQGTGAGPTLGVRGSQALTGQRLAPRSATLLAPSGFATRTSPLAGAFLRDYVNLGAAPFVGGYEVGAGTVEAIGSRGRNTSRLQRVGKGAIQGVTQSVPARLAVGDVKGAKRSLEEHPGFALLDFLGAESVAGRSLGALARGVGKEGASGVRGTAARIGSTKRPGLALGSETGAGVIERRYSKDLLRKAVQVAIDRKRPEGPDGTVAPATELGRKHLQARRGDIVAGRANARERMLREQAAHERTTSGRTGAAVRNTKAQVTGAEPVTAVNGRHARDIVALAVQGAITSADHMSRDLHAISKRLDSEYAARIGTKGFRHSAEARANRRNAQLVERVRTNPKAMAQAKAILAEAERHGRALNAGDVAKAAAGIGETPRMRRAALEVPALEHMGARHFTVEEHARLEAKAREAEKIAERNLRTEQANRFATPSALRNRREALAAAREHRIAVSGRPPEKVRAYEAAKAELITARERLTRAEKAHSSAKARAMALGHEHRSARAREQMTKGPVAVFHVGEKRFVTHAEAHKYAKARGLKVERIATSVDEAKRVGARAQAKLREESAYKAKRAANKAVKAAARKLQKNPMPEAQAAIRYGERSKALGFDKPAGTHLPNEHIESFLRSRGRDPGTVAYLPHRGDVVGRRAYHSQLRLGTRASDPKEVRTGSAYLKGATKTTADLIKDQGVRQAVQLNHAHEIDRTIADHGMLHPAVEKARRGEPLTAHEERIVKAGGSFTVKEGLELAQRVLEDTGEYLVPVRRHPVVSDATRQVIEGNMRGPGGMDSIGQRLLNDRIVTEALPGDKGARNVAMMPGHLVDRMNAHLRPSGQLAKAAQTLNRAFRFAVLPQFRWLTGNFVEPYFVRLPAHGSGVVNIPGMLMDIQKNRQMLRRLKRSRNPEERQAALDMESGRLGGLFIGQRGATNRRTLEDFPTLDRTVQDAYGKIVARAPVMESFGEITGHLLGRGAQAILAPLKAFFLINRGIERGAQHAAEGHFLRDDLQEFTGSWLQTIRTGEKAWQEAIRGRVNTPTQHRLLDQAHELLGKYDSWSPMMRAIVQGPAPFIPWMLNAARFVYWTMPAHHSALTSLLVKVDQTFQKTWDEQHANVPPGSLKYAIPNGRGGWVDLARYGPWGATAPAIAGEGLRGASAQFFPQLGGTQAAISGKDPFGRDLQVPKTPKNPQGKASTGQEIGIALNQLAEALTPYLATGRRLREGGGTAYGNSTVFSPKTKPGTKHMSALRRTFDPFRPTYLRGGPGGQTEASAPSSSGKLPVLRLGVTSSSQRPLPVLRHR